MVVAIAIFIFLSFINLRYNAEYSTNISLACALINLFPISIVLLFNSYVIENILVKKLAYFQFAVILIITVFATISIEIFLFKIAFKYLTIPESDKLLAAQIAQYSFSCYMFLFFDFLLSFMFITGLNYLGKWIRVNNQKNKLSNENIELQLEILKSQINPHFLFNSLNNIYSLIIEKFYDDAGNFLLKLSHILRYTLYETNNKFVPLHKEIEMVKNFIELQKLRFNNTEKISMTTDINNNNASIAPFLIISIIENAFKFSDINKNINGFIHINITETNFQFCLNVNNSYEITQKLLPAEHSGIGLNNIKKRLEMIYNNKHLFKIDTQKQSYFSTLQIDLQG